MNTKDVLVVCVFKIFINILASWDDVIKIVIVVLGISWVILYNGFINSEK
jgi:hypothetical protein